MTKTIVNNSDPRVIKTRKQFKEAFKELMLLYDDFMSVTVKELCDKAGLNRKTFYLHYKQTDELLLEIQNEYVGEFYELTKQYNFYNDIEKVVEVYFDLNENNPVYKKMAISSVYFFNREISRKRMIEFFNNKGMTFYSKDYSPVVMDFLYFFYDMNLYIMYKRWVLKNNPLPKEEMIVLTAKLIRDGLPEKKQPQE